MTEKNERAQRGKTAEKQVESLFKGWNSKADFAWHRLPDARAAMGRLAAQPADYIYWSGGVGGFLEVKQTDHEYRLAKDKIKQLPTLRKFSMAGARSFVLVLHTTLGQWRVAPSSWFEVGATSWDLRDLPLYPTAEDALLSMGVFK